MLDGYRKRRKKTFYESIEEAYTAFKSDTNLLGQIDLVIEHTFGVKAKELDEEAWLNFYAKYRYLKEIDIEIQSKVITKGVLDAAKILFE